LTLKKSGIKVEYHERERLSDAFKSILEGEGMKHKHQLQKTVGIFMIVILIAGLAALPALAGVTDGNPGKTGQTIDIKRFVKPGQTTIIDFWSKNCPPCMKLGPMLEAMAAKRPKTQVVKLNIDRPGAQGIDFDSPLAKQYKLQGVPHLMVFDESGTLKAQGQEAINMVLPWCQ
jgi:thiol-disulfide isomerase/thioredoxin